ncbi:MAG: DUF4402 domain-containing protein [Sphingomonadales bacterium]|nr:DUF4402 domain-containing protein [Sphingomonadales bacterium]
MTRGNHQQRGRIARDVLSLALALACALLAFLPGAAHAQSRPASGKVTATAGARAVIVTKLSFIKVNDLDFGKIVAGNTAGTLVLSPFNVRTVTGGVRAALSTSRPAVFAGFGTLNQNLTIAMSANSVVLRRAGGTQTMTMDTFVIGSTPTATITTAPTTFYIGSANGQFQFPVGATLRVGANQTPGVYSGTFSITLNYL